MLRLLGILAFIWVTIALPAEERTEHVSDGGILGDSVLFNEGMFEGDIAGVDPNEDRNAIADLRKLWPGGKVYFRMAPSAEPIRKVIMEGMEQIKTKTGGCIEFIESHGDGNYLNIKRANGCWAKVGMQGNGVQPVSLGYGCQFIGLVVHELCHAIGLWHEQNRSDRDDYITINLDNVANGQRHNFKKLTPQENILIVPYDYQSIMQYGEYAFSKDASRLKTIVPKKPGVTIIPVYKRPGLVASDVEVIKTMYQCDGKVRPTAAPPIDLVANFTSGWDWLHDEQSYGKHFQRVQLNGNWVVMADTAKTTGGDVQLYSDTIKIYGVTTACLSFRYKVAGSGVKFVKIQQNSRRETFDIWNTSPVSAMDWKTEKLSIKTPTKVQLFVRVGTINGGAGKIYFDDFKYHYGGC